MQSSNTSSSSGAFGNDSNSQHSGVSSSGRKTSSQELLEHLDLELLELQEHILNASTNFIQSLFGSKFKEQNTQQQTNTKKSIS